MPQPRTRETIFETVSGTRKRLTGAPYTIYRDNGGEVCEDVTNGFGVDNYFLLTRVRREGGLLNGETKSSNGTVQRYWINVPTRPENTVSAYNPTFGGLSSEQASVQAAARTNPSRPDILLPVFLKELGDIPKMIKNLGNGILKARNQITEAQMRRRSYPGFPTAPEAGSAWLSYNFGWAPLIGDLHKLANFQTSVDQRRKELDRLGSGNGLKRRVTLFREDAKYPNEQYLLQTDDGYGISVRGDRNRMAHRWATLRWKPTSDYPLRISDQQLRNMLLGCTLESVSANLWEALPWSWLIDYFYNVGDVLQRANNHIGARLVSCCVMSHYSQTVHVPSSKPTGSTIFSQYDYVSEVKRRFVTVPGILSLGAGFPILSVKQVSILGSLAVTRGRR